jgi:single stranded DNA-binding protein
MIPDFTSAAFSGRLTADPKKFETKGDKVLCRFTVASNKRIGKDSEKTAFMPVLVTGTEATNCLKYLSKGREVLITGATFETDDWEDREGNKRKGFTFVVARGGMVTFGSGGRKSDENNSDSESASSARDKVSNKLKSDSGL